MLKSLSRPVMRSYPQVDFRKRGGRTFDLPSACWLLKAKYPFLNLAGLAGMERLSVHVRSQPISTGVRHEFLLFSRQTFSDDQPKAVIEESLRSKRIALLSFYPDLPADNRLGLTLFFLILTRGNSFAGQKIEIDIASPALEEMALRMKGFKVKNPEDKPLTIKVPKLTPDELAASEWYWVNVLKCPLL